jgi:hypothetical protein
MRELIFSDVFKLSRILKKINIKNEIDVKDKTQEEVGVAMFLALGENLYLAEKEINDFMGDLFGMSGEDFGKQNPTAVMKCFDEFRNTKGVAGFFKLAAQLMK